MSGERLDSHNTSVDSQMVDVGRCGQIHLASGRICIRPVRHPGSCDFEAPEQVLDGSKERSTHQRWVERSSLSNRPSGSGSTT
jgi:hypothetical protein